MQHGIGQIQDTSYQLIRELFVSICAGKLARMQLTSMSICVCDSREAIQSTQRTRQGRQSCAPDIYFISRTEHAVYASLVDTPL